MRALWQRVRAESHHAKPHQRQAVSNDAAFSTLSCCRSIIFTLSLDYIRSSLPRDSFQSLCTLLYFCSTMLTPHSAPARSPTAASSHPAPQPLRTHPACTATWRPAMAGCPRTRGKSVRERRSKRSVKAMRSSGIAKAQTSTVKAAHRGRLRKPDTSMKPTRATRARAARRGRRAGQRRTSSRHASCPTSHYPRRRPHMAGLR